MLWTGMSCFLYDRTDEFILPLSLKKQKLKGNMIVYSCSVCTLQVDCVREGLLKVGELKNEWTKCM